eukprot:gene35003-43162_t
MKPGTLFPCLACALLLTACANESQLLRSEQPAATLDSALAEAGRVAAAGQQDKAMGLLRSAAGSYPADKAPWLSMAQMKFDRASYGEAILHAQEALQRDPGDQVGNSIIAVSGLRLSTKALADLSQQNNLSGSLRSEARDLARVLRTSLGEEVLVFAAWAPGVLEDYIAAGLKPHPDGVQLRFTRENETAVYRSLPHHIGALVKPGLAVPAGFIGGAESVENRQAGLDATRRLVGENFRIIPGGHLFPMESPELTARVTHEMISQLLAQQGAQRQPQPRRRA